MSETADHSKYHVFHSTENFSWPRLNSCCGIAFLLLCAIVGPHTIESLIIDKIMGSKKTKKQLRHILSDLYLALN